MNFNPRYPTDMDDTTNKVLTCAEVSEEYNPTTQSWIVNGWFTDDFKEKATAVAEIFLDGSLKCFIEGITPDTDTELRYAINTFHSDDYINNEDSDFEKYILYAFKELSYYNSQDCGEIAVYNPDGVCAYEIGKTELGDTYIYAFRLKDADEWTMILLKEDSEQEICEKVIPLLYEDIVSAVGETFRLDM